MRDACQYATLVGERSKRGKGYRSQKKLPGGDHTALLGDALATLPLI